jgi:hypothetical protein
MTPAQAAVKAFDSLGDNFNHPQAITARLRDGGMSATDSATALNAAIREGLLALSDLGSVSKPKRAAVELRRVEFAIGSLHDFELENGEIQRLRYEGNGKWFDDATGTVLDKAPKHRNVVSLAQE